MTIWREGGRWRVRYKVRGDVHSHYSRRLVVAIADAIVYREAIR